MTEAEGRAEVIRVAYEWLGTPFADCGRVKGKNGGVDCAQFAFCVYREVKLIDAALYREAPKYPSDWFLHRDEDKLLEIVRRFARETSNPKPADLALWKFGRTYSHVAIMLDRPNIIHADVEAGEVILGYENGGRLANRTPIFFSRW